MATCHSNCAPFQFAGPVRLFVCIQLLIVFNPILPPARRANCLPPLSPVAWLPERRLQRRHSTLLAARGPHGAE